MAEVDDIIDLDHAGPALHAGGFDVATAATILSRDPHITIGRGQLFHVLEHAEWILREPVAGRLVPTQRALAHGWVVVDRAVIRRGNARDTVPQVRITVDGLKRLREHLTPPDEPPEPTLFD